MENTVSKEARLPSGRKAFIKNIIVVLVSNGFSALSGIVIGFLVPKLLSVSDYGYYKTFTLYSTYIGLLHFGFIDGIYLKFAGQSYESLDKEKFRFYTRFLMLMEGAFSLLVMLISLFFIQSSLLFIFLFVGMNIFLTNMTSYFELLCQATMRFKRRSVRKIILCVLNIISVGIIYSLNRWANVSISGLIYIEIVCGISAVILLWYFITYRHIVFGKGSSFKAEKENVASFFRMGVLLLFATLVSQFIFSVDQQFINVFFDEEVYAKYAFAYNMINVILIATSAISVVFFPAIKQMSEGELVDKYPTINSYFLIFVSFCLISYYPIEMVVRFFLDKYIGSLPIFAIVLPGAVISSCITSIKYNCYKAFGMVRTFFFLSLAILGISIAADAAVYFIFKEPKFIAIASIVVLVVWYVLTELVFYKKYKTPWLKNAIYMLAIIGSFYGIAFIGNIYIELGIFALVYCGITYLMFFRAINALIKRLVGRMKNRVTSGTVNTEAAKESEAGSLQDGPTDDPDVSE